MSESVKLVTLEHFRGLPNTEFDVGGKNIAILGSNGKGKSGLVDGFEYLFSGQVGRFVGAGTQGINHDEAVCHIRRGGTPKVSITLSPSRAVVSRTLGTEAPAYCQRPQGKAYLEGHPGVNAFILRRAQILEFISNNASDRYRKFVQLLGISEIDGLQGAFVAAEKESAGTAKTTSDAYKAKLAAFDDPASQFAPKNLNELLAKVATVAEGLGVGKVSDWDVAAKVLVTLKEKRPEANKEKIDTLSKATVVLEMALDPALKAELEDLAAKSRRLKEVSTGIADAAKSDIIDGGLTFFAKHPDEGACPLCEQTLPDTVDSLLSRLHARSAALRELKEAQSARNTSLARVRATLGAIAAHIARDLGHAEQLLPEAVESLKVAKADAEALLEAAKTSDDLTHPESLQGLPALRAGCLADLKVKKEALVAPDSSKLEGAIALVERAIASADAIRAAFEEANRSSEIARRAKFANAAFKKSRETAIEAVFTRISGTVLAFYKKLHDCEEQNERSECTGLELKPDSRAAAGGLKLAIQFLELEESKDPRAFLSEGHLDSLGLCIFLATVKIFNPPGTLLVLDDVLTSIDKDHRHRVGELLFDEFSEYQILLTTHDEYWFDLLKSLSRARGIQGTWKFTKVEGWTVERGPTLSVNDDSWAFINANLNEASYRELGGPLRLVLEDFLKRAAVKLETKVKFKIDGKYTSGDFAAAGIQDDIRKKLSAAVKADAGAATTEAAVQTAVGRVFGTGDLINFLSHDNPGRLEVTFPQAQDFVSGLKFLIDQCARYSLMRGQ